MTDAAHEVFARARRDESAKYRRPVGVVMQIACLTIGGLPTSTSIRAVRNRQDQAAWETQALSRPCDRTACSALLR